MKGAILASIRFYKRRISPVISGQCGVGCKYLPTCSSYAYEAVEKHGALKGCALALWRLIRCNPFSKGGYDPVP